MEETLIKVILEPGDMFSGLNALLNRSSFKSYSCITECELLTIKVEDFFYIIKRYPEEWAYCQNCVEEFNPLFEKIYQNYSKRHKQYLKKLRKRHFHHNPATAYETTIGDNYVDLDPGWRMPDSKFMFYWMVVRAFTVVVSILGAALQGGSGVLIRENLIIMETTCDCIAAFDILLKMFVAYYNDIGIVIVKERKCIVNYLSRGFLMDIIGIIPWDDVLRATISKDMTESSAMVVNTVSKFSHLYILVCFFNYIANSPSINNVYLLILKWQIVAILVVVGAGHFVLTFCVEYTFNSHGALTRMTYKNASCWLSTYYKLDSELTNTQLHLVFAESLNFVQAVLMSNFNALVKFPYSKKPIVILFLRITRLLFMYITSYNLMLLILRGRDGSIIQHGVRQLKKFLKAEGVDRSLIKNVEAHFSYWWTRTKGIDTDRLMCERIGVILREDLYHFFYKKTFMALDTLLKGGAPIRSRLSYSIFQTCCLPNEQIVREMDYTQDLLVVHRGNVIITKNGQRLDVVGRGAIFGPLNSNRPRPIKISAKSVGYADILHIPITDFQDIINDQVRANIAENPQSENDYMSTNIEVKEDPYRTLAYLFRGRKSLHLPGFKNPIEAKKNWYSKFLLFTWFISPTICALVVLLLGFLPIEIKAPMSWCLCALDAIHIVYIITDFFTTYVCVDEDRLVKKRMKYKIFKCWGFYFDLISLVVPVVSVMHGQIWCYHLARLLRLRLFYLFHKHFCTGFKSRLMPTLLKCVIIMLVFHGMICGWIYVACQDSKFPSYVTDSSSEYEDKIDFSEWERPGSRKGCYAIDFKMDQANVTSFIVPKKWQNDYVVAMSYVILKFTQSGLVLVIPLSVTQICYGVAINYLIYLLDQWIISIVISAVYTKFRELYHYDYNVNNLIKYLLTSGLSPVLLQSVKKYTKQLWQRQRGNWLPELVHQAPTCLREDLFSALYSHHLTTAPIFKNLPEYFRRQLATRFQRHVVFPGKRIVEEGDIFACIFFIHEGDVEKWQADHK